MYVRTSPASPERWEMRGMSNPFLVIAGSIGSCCSGDTRLSVRAQVCPTDVISHLYIAVEGKKADISIVHLAALLFC